jgi:hypothetical protein
MAGLKGNIAWLLAQAQSAKGTPATPTVAKAHKMPMSGGNIGPTRTTERLSETDASRDAGLSYVQQTGVEGSPEFYVRDKPMPFWLWAAMGSLASSGTTNYTHTVTPGNSLPYITTWRNIGDVLYERFADCKVGSLSISADAGSPLTMTAGIQGLQTSRLTVAPDDGAVVPVEAGTVYNFNRATVTLGGSVTALVSSFELSIENNVSTQQTDDSIPYDVVEGLREVSLGFDLIFESLAEYNKFHYGGAAGVAIDPGIFTTSAIFTFTLGVNNEISFNLPSIAYEEFPIEPDPGGDPIVASVRAVGQRSGSPIVTATVKNQTAGTAYAA